jgi:amidophosphoribosyltransferase
VRRNNTASRNLAMAGNFNMTNSAELFQQLLEYGLNPVGESDTQVVLERVGYFLDKEHDHLRSAMGPESFQGLSGRDLADAVSRELDLKRVITRAAEGWDGGYLFVGALGNGDVFACRDPAGIRPGFFFLDDDVLAVASERVALVSVFDVDPSRIEPILPGHVLVMKRDGRFLHEPFASSIETRQCTFERVYFSRGNDPDIYAERKSLGRHLAPRVLEAMDHDVDHAIFSYIPNTAEAAYVGLVDEVDRLHRQREVERIGARMVEGSATPDDLRSLVQGRIRAEKIAHKDQRLRTFITHDAARQNLVMHIYDITRGVVSPEDTLVVIDDSIVRGTTLRESIITILSRLRPARIMVVSSAPPIMYPDCYGIDMSQLGRFIAFEAAVALLRERGEEELLEEVERRCLEQAKLPPERMSNQVGAIYDRLTLDDLSAKIAELVRPSFIDWHGRIDVLYQTIDGLQASMPGHTGDWYFTGRYPTPGGYQVLNTSYLNWRRKQDVRAYEAPAIPAEPSLLT